MFRGILEEGSPVVTRDYSAFSVQGKRQRIIDGLRSPESLQHVGMKRRRRRRKRKQIERVAASRVPSMKEEKKLRQLQVGNSHLLSHSVM